MTKLLLGASSMLLNGTLVARAGTALVCMLAHSHGVPALVCCETYKFAERVLLDSICFNELGDPDELIPPPLRPATGVAGSAPATAPAPTAPPAAPAAGGGVTTAAEIARQPHCPVQAHFGAKDHWIPLDTVEAFRQAHPQVEVHVYDADHGFNCNHRASFDAAAADQARARALAFFAAHVG